jgi:hypothetical protein
MGHRKIKRLSDQAVITEAIVVLLVSHFMCSILIVTH